MEVQCDAEWVTEFSLPSEFADLTEAKASLPALDTIVAISTPPGRGGIGIVRLAGPFAVPIANTLVRLVQPLQHAQARFARVLDLRPDANAGEVIDEAIVTAFFAPQSYTGDDIVEIAAHGAPVVLEAILSAALVRGARLAEPGEFTQRAFLDGRLDLTQAEAVHDLIAAQTLEQARAAAQQLGGALSRRLAPAKEQLLHLIALLEAGMDFAAGELDDVDLVPPSQISSEIRTVRESLDLLARSFHAGSLLRSGISLALVGRPNAGKSSLFNKLLERPRAIVTPVPGTTRDTVEEIWSLAGMPLRLIDTAGLRLAHETPADEAEQQGIERSREALADADLVLLVHDATTPITAEERSLALGLQGRPHLLLRNKVDLLTSEERADEPTAAAIPTSAPIPFISALPVTAPEAKPGPEPTAMIEVSALTGEGMQTLRNEILKVLHVSGDVAETGALNNRRQQQTVLAALTALAAAHQANEARLPHEMLLLDLHTALHALDALTGQTTADDILAHIFSTFCIGK